MKVYDVHLDDRKFRVISQSSVWAREAVVNYLYTIESVRVHINDLEAEPLCAVQEGVVLE